MFNVSSFQLKLSAGLVWYAGSITLFLKGQQLLQAALILRPESSSSYYVYLIGIGVGLIKTRYIFIKSAKKNIARIYGLQKPKIWNIFRPKFFIFLALMIASGVVLSFLSRGNFLFLLSVASIDFSLSTALSVSGLLYLKNLQS